MKNGLSRAVSIALVVAAATPALAQEQTQTATNLDTVSVTGSALRSQEAVDNRREALGIEDSLTQDDTGDLADETLADALIRVPGVSAMQTLYGEQEAAYVSTRGISPDLNFVSFDGMAMFSSANDGNGTRRVDLNLIPTQISRTTRVYKSFTADLDAGAIGGVINIEPYSALNGKETMYVDAQLTQQTGHNKYIPGTNSLGRYKDEPLGLGLKGLWVNRFGADDQFGVVLSAVHREKNYDYTKRNPNGRVFYTAAGTTAAADLSNWDGLHPFPQLIRPMDYTHYTQTRGGSAQFEYRISDFWQASLLGYGYKQVEDQSYNWFYVENFTGLTRPSAEEGRFKIGRVRPDFAYDRFENKTMGVIAKAVGDIGEQGRLEVRLGHNENEFYDSEQKATYAYSPTNSYITFDMSDVVDRISIENNDPLVDISNYSLNAARDLLVRSKMTSDEARIDFKNNYRSGSTGFGFATGLGLREVDAMRDSATTTFISDGSAMGNIGFVPGFISHNYGYPVVWIDYEKFSEQVKPNLAVNTTASSNAAWSADYGYTERVLSAYASLKYGTDNTQAIAGLRLDDVDYEARSPLSTAGRYDGTFQVKKGSYSNVLPSASLVHNLTPDFRIKAAYSKSLGRPQFDDIARAEIVNEDTLTISRGNIDLKPRRADNYDLAAEYFFAGSGMLSLGGFYKDIKDDIYSLRQEEEIDGVVYEVTTPRNSSASKMRGLEFQVMHDAIPGLPGFLNGNLGASFNATKMWAEMDYLSGTRWVHLDALQYQPDWLANATVFYRLPKNGEVRLSYNWKGESPISLGAYPWTTYWLRKQERLDLAVRYSFSKNFIVKFQANNVLEEPVEQGYQEPFAMNRYEMTRDRTYSLDLIYKL